MKKKSFLKCQRGASAVEFAIVLPLLLLFIFGIIEFGILFYNKAVITNASREGARTAILYDMEGETPIYKTAADVQNVVLNYCSNFLINFSGSKTPSVDTTDPVVSGTPPARYRTVTVTLDYNFFVLPDILNGLFGGTMEDGIPLTAVTRMRTEHQGT